jgi:hypothetical protein
MQIMVHAIFSLTGYLPSVARGIIGVVPGTGEGGYPCAGFFQVNCSPMLSASL